MTDFASLDPGRQADVRQIEHTLRTSRNPAERAAAERALAAIKREAQDSKLRDARRWYLNEKEHGRFENAKNFLESVEKDPQTYNPYGSYRNG